MIPDPEVAVELLAPPPEEELPTIAVALSRAMNDARAVGKTSHSDQGNFSYRGVDAVVNAAAPALRAHGVVVTPDVRSIEHSTIEVGRNRSIMAGVRVLVRYTFTGPRGDRLRATVAAEAMDSGDKATAKAMSVALRTVLLQALVLPTDDPDPDETVYERSAAAPEIPRNEAVVNDFVEALRAVDDPDVLDKLRNDLRSWTVGGSAHRDDVAEVKAVFDETVERVAAIEAARTELSAEPVAEELPTVDETPGETS